MAFDRPLHPLWTGNESLFCTGTFEIERDDSLSGFFIQSRRKTKGSAGLNRGQYRAIRVKDDEMISRWMQIAGFAGVPDNVKKSADYARAFVRFYVILHGIVLDFPTQ